MGAPKGNIKREWKSVPGYEGFYVVSNDGKVKSLKRIITRKNGRKQSWPETELKPMKGKRGYLTVGLNKIGNTKTRDIHQLVAMAFLNHVPCKFELVVNHINHNKLDNRLENLEVITNRQNTNQAHLKSKSKFVGVTFDKTNNTWVSRIRHNGKRKKLGTFRCETKAFIAYQNELKKIIALDERG